MKRSSLMKLLALLILLGTLTTCSCSSARQSPVYMTDIDDGSSMTYGNAISVSLQKKYYEASESIVFEIGIGTDLVFSELYGVSEDSYAYVTANTSIIAVRDEEIFYSDTKHYDSFHTDERFLNARAVYGSPHVVSTKRPAYFEDFEMSFPEGECIGFVSFALVDYLVFEDSKADGTEETKPDKRVLSLIYAKNDKYIVFSTSSAEAQQMLEDLSD